MKKVLVVEDSLTIRFHVSAALCAAGFEVVHACDGSVALREWANHKDIAAVLLDMNLPYVDGMEVLERMRTDPTRQGVPVLVLTAGTDEEQLERAARNGAVGCLLKPVNSELLVNTLASLTA